MRPLLLCLLLLGGCATAPNCYVGLSIFPLGPFVHCGVDHTPLDATEYPPLDD